MSLVALQAAAPPTAPGCARSACIGCIGLISCCGCGICCCYRRWWRLCGVQLATAISKQAAEVGTLLASIMPRSAPGGSLAAGYHDITCSSVTRRRRMPLPGLLLLLLLLLLLFLLLLLLLLLTMLVGIQVFLLCGAKVPIVTVTICFFCR